MKTKLILTSILAVALLSIAADSPIIADNLTMVQSAPASGNVQSFWQKTIDLSDGKGPTSYGPPVETDWPIAAIGTVSITLSDGSVAQTTYAAVAAAMVTIATQEHGKK